MTEPTISPLRAAPGLGGVFVDDQAAIRSGVTRDGFGYLGEPVTRGFRGIRDPSPAVVIVIVTSDGQVATGDCVAVQYTGVGGREEIFSPLEVATYLNEEIAPRILGSRLTSFRDLAARCDEWRWGESPLPSAISYGLTQAFLHAVALAQRRTMAEVIVEEFATGVELSPVALFAQSGDERYLSVDRMILKRVEVLPHGLINSPDKVGPRGVDFVEYVSWVSRRVRHLSTEAEYRPTLHFDTYGTLGIACGNQLTELASLLSEVGEAAQPFNVQIEHPIDGGTREAQILLMSELRRLLKESTVDVKIVADEWCNTLEDIREFVTAGAVDLVHVKVPDVGGLHHSVEALLYLREQGVGRYFGGSCTETDVSARVSAQVAMACGANQVLAKPGMGVDEGIQIMRNEMTRVMLLTS